MGSMAPRLARPTRVRRIAAAAAAAQRRRRGGNGGRGSGGNGGKNASPGISSDDLYKLEFWNDGGYDVEDGMEDWMWDDVDSDDSATLTEEEEFSEESLLPSISTTKPNSDKRAKVLSGRPSSSRVLLSHALDVAESAASLKPSNVSCFHFASSGTISNKNPHVPVDSALLNKITRLTPFYDPHTASDVRAVVAHVNGWEPWNVDGNDMRTKPTKHTSDIVVAAVGGHSSPERIRYAFLPRRAVASLNTDAGNNGAHPALASGVTLLDAVAVACVQVRLMSRAPGASLSHRSIVGAILATGLQRSSFGDVVVISSHVAFVYVDPKHARTLEDGLTSVGRDEVEVELTPLGDAASMTAMAESIMDIVDDADDVTNDNSGTTGDISRVSAASDRLDAVLPKIFKGVGRSDVAKLVKKGHIELNHNRARGVPLKPSASLSVGDVVSVRRHGRFVVNDISTKPSKGDKKPRVVVAVAVSM